MPQWMRMERWWRPSRMRPSRMTPVKGAAGGVALLHSTGLEPRLVSLTPPNTCRLRFALARTTQSGLWDGDGQAIPARTIILFLEIIRSRDKRLERSFHDRRS